MVPYLAAGRPSHEPHGIPSASGENGALSSTLRGLRSVVAEDEGVTQVQLRRILRSHGVDVVASASNGVEAVNLVKQHRPDFVLMDIRMPVMDGLAAAQLILEDGPMCIILLTAFSDNDYRQQALEIGASGYILKPVTSDILIPQIELAVKRYRNPVH